MLHIFLLFAALILIAAVAGAYLLYHKHFYDMVEDLLTVLRRLKLRQEEIEVEIRKSEGERKYRKIEEDEIVKRFEKRGRNKPEVYPRVIS